MAKLKLGSFFIMLASACGMYGQDFDKMVESLIDRSVPLIYPDSLSKIQNKESVVILDARDKEEYEVSHIEHAIWVGYKDFDLSKLNVNRESDIVIYCSVGYRSEKIGEKLNEAGYSNVHNLYGGIFNWKNSDKVVIDNNGNETEKVHAYSKSWGRWLIKGEKVYE